MREKRKSQLSITGTQTRYIGLIDQVRYPLDHGGQKQKSIKMLAAPRFEPGRHAYEANALSITPRVQMVEVHITSVKQKKIVQRAP